MLTSTTIPERHTLLQYRGCIYKVSTGDTDIFNPNKATAGAKSQYGPTDNPIRVKTETVTCTKDVCCACCAACD